MSSNPESIAREFIRGTRVDLTHPEEVCRFIEQYSFTQCGYICLFGLYPLSESFHNPKLQQAYNRSLLNPLHGTYIEYYLRFKKKASAEMQTVDGPFLLDRLLKTELSHYFYGTNQETLEKIKDRITREYPEASVLGYKAPPYLEVDEVADNELLPEHFQEIDNQKPNIIWVGLGGIKQDYVMHHYSKYCTNSIMIGVGAALNDFAGTTSLGPEFIKAIGLRWLYRGLFQPRIFGRVFKALKNIIITY